MGKEVLDFLQNSGDGDARNPWGNIKTEPEARAVFREIYPAIYEHMSHYETDLRDRSDQGRFWWELRPCDYYAEFEKPKIVWPDIAKQCEFGFDDQNLYPDCTLFIVPEADLYLLGILNSTVVEWFYRHVSPMIQQDFLRFKRIYLRQITIPNATPTERATIDSLVRDLLEAKGAGSQVAEWEHELNTLVYELYDLTNEEIRIVEVTTETMQDLQGGGA